MRLTDEFQPTALHLSLSKAHGGLLVRNCFRLSGSLESNLYNEQHLYQGSKAIISRTSQVPREHTEAVIQGAWAWLNL